MMTSIQRESEKIEAQVITSIQFQQWLLGSDFQHPTPRNLNRKSQDPRSIKPIRQFVLPNSSQSSKSSSYLPSRIFSWFSLTVTSNMSSKGRSWSIFSSVLSVFSLPRAWFPWHPSMYREGIYLGMILTRKEPLMDPSKCEFNFFTFLSHCRILNHEFSTCYILMLCRPESLGIVVGIVFLVVAILFQYFNFAADSNVSTLCFSSYIQYISPFPYSFQNKL